ncbi:hypothetical protein [Cryptosporangium phraense]|uniref:Uncharacterized protein n=1 Tax=Cryptosporangium phraense TaxID=2593070 RepID=A0A545AL45_9ACTN|nr:hypothetical protein [Cryptosporangium phraense]TQS41980.1 hypothetical protein FL583_27255 [Cryptosporangium phraense]
MSSKFQSLEVPAAALNGSISAQVLDPGSQPTEIVTGSSAWQIEVEWEIRGFLVPSLAGTWRVQTAFDPVGPGAGQLFPAAPQNVTLTPTNGNYRVVFNLANAIPNGTYEVVVNLSYVTAAGTPGRMAGLVELGTVVVQA